MPKTSMIDKASGVLTFAEAPDYEMAADGDTNNEYTVTVVATDADGMTTNEAVTVDRHRLGRGCDV